METTPQLKYRVDLPGGQSRLRELILYICAKCEGAKSFGKTKLNKILWKADFDAHAARGVPVTGRAYQRLKAGPAPIDMPPLFGEMVRDGLVRIQTRDAGGGFTEQRPIALEKANLRYFSEDDISFVDAAIRYFWDKTATRTSDLSHGIAWKSRDDGDPMPYDLAYLNGDPASSDLKVRILEIASKKRWKTA